MIVISELNFSSSVDLYKSTHYFRNISVLDNRFGVLLRNLTASDNDKITRLLNKINDQHILSFDVASFSYKVESGEVLSFSQLSTGERIFLLCYAANRVGTKIYLNALNRLSKSSLLLLFNTFKNSEFINLVVDDYYFEYYNDLLAGMH